MVVTRSGKGSHTDHRHTGEIATLGGNSIEDTDAHAEQTTSTSEPSVKDAPIKVAPHHSTASGIMKQTPLCPTLLGNQGTTEAVQRASNTDGATMKEPYPTEDGRGVTAAHSDRPSAAAVQAHLPARHAAASRASTSTKARSMRARELAIRKEELLRLKIEYELARIARIEAESSEEEEDIQEDNGGNESQRRVADWVDQSLQHQLTALSKKELPPLPQNEKAETRKMPHPPGAPAAAKPECGECSPPVCVPAGAREMTVKQQSLDISELAQAITLAAQSTRPTSRNFFELPSYSGSHQEWLSFNAAYTATAPSYNDVENLARLRKSLKGTAREAVENLLMYNADPHDVMKTLQSRFGRPDAIAQAELDRLRALPRLTDSARDVCMFATKVNNIVATLRALKKQHYLYNPEITKLTIEKFTPVLRYRWYDFAAFQPEDDDAELLKLSRFLEREAQRCAPYAQPEQPTMAAPTQRVATHSTLPRRPPQKTYAATVEPTATVTATEKLCPVCQKPGHTAATKCPQYIDAGVDERWDIAKDKGLCFRCLKYRTRKHSCKPLRCKVDDCDRTHHPLLHFVKKGENETEVVSTARTTEKTHSFLKILPVTVTGPRGDYSTYALLDDGSTVTLIDAAIARKIGAKGPIDPLHIEALSNKMGEAKSQRVKITVQGTSSKVSIQARTINSLRLSPQRVERSDVINCPHLAGISARLIHDAVPKILIGQDNWELLLATETKRGERHQPVASLTPLGWVLHGAHTRTLGKRVHYVNHIVTQEENMDEQLRQYFAIESIAITPKRPHSDPEQRALNILAERTVRREDGRYETSLLWRTDDAPMPNNYDNALKRLQTTEKKIDKDPLLKKKYEEQMEALIQKGYAEPAPADCTEKRTWYLPHFAVLNPMKPGKVRVVHDAAAKTKGVSLNDYLLTGPDLLQSLPGVLMRLRQHCYAVSADIREMFMQVKIRKEDRDALRYLWRGGERGDTPPREYRMTSLIFGATSSPATAIYVKNVNAERYKEKEPDVYNAVIRNHYVDDYLQSFTTVNEAIATASRVRDIHSEAHYELRQWKSNSAEIVAALAETTTASQPVTLDGGTTTERVLGLVWKPHTDELAFNLDLARLPQDILQNTRPTKREALKIVMSLFDPLGFASPVISRAKQLLQEVWRRGTDWDQRIDDDLAAQWTEWTGYLQKLAGITMPRCHPHYSDASDLQLHVFVDASEAAFAAALYWRITAPDGHVITSLVMGKSKVAPLKVTSIPRLELQAAVMGSRMAATVIDEHDRKPDSVTYWTDSRTVLTWLKTGARSYKPYVAHRIAAIEENSKLSQWRWVPTKLNVADDATRNVPGDFDAQHRWFRGPPFLLEDPTTWPEDKQKTSEEKTGEERTNYVRQQATSKLTDAIPDSNRFSKWERLLRATARVLQFIALCRPKIERINYKRTKKNREADPAWGRKQTGKPKPQVTMKPTEADRSYRIIEAGLMVKAEKLLIIASQRDSFPEEIAALQQGCDIATNSRLRPLAVQLVDGVIKIVSRIAATTGIQEEVKTPAIIDGNHTTAKLYIDFTHRQLHHANVETTINECRQHYWILRLRPTARMVIHRCLPCRLRKTAPPQPSTGNHPLARLAHHQRPFTYTGLDYFGPLTVTVGRSKQKRYVALFTCLTTRAVHLEIAASLTTDSAIMALRRMIARRGCPTEIWSDNGTNLQGADKELRRAIDQATEQEATNKKISWRFIPPAAPFMGGAWERLVRSVKNALYVALKETNPTEEVLNTLLAEVEYTVNSRPLTHVSTDPNDPEAITPNHFLLGGSARVVTPGTFDDSDLIGRTHWRASQRLADIFWSRWIREYLPELQHRREPRSKGPALRIGDVVLIADNTLPRNTWPRGLIVATYPGTDGIVRTADVKTKGGILRRPTKKLVVLQSTEEASLPRNKDASTEATDDARRENVRDGL